MSEILATLTARGQSVLLAGALAPPNLGTAYAAAFNAIYPDLAAEYRVPLYPFFLAGVVTNTGLTQADGLHPNAAGVAAIVQSILPDVEALVMKAVNGL
jgi:acyl-CoA thioesterase-1